MRAEVRFHVAALALLAVFGAAVGCARKPDDAKITGAVQASFDADSGLQGKQLNVQSDNGTVTISGTVDNDLERNAAARYAAAAPGVTQVVNNLRVAGEQASVTSPVLLCSTPVRFHLKRLLEAFMPKLVVLSPGEIPPAISVQSVGVLR